MFAACHAWTLLAGPMLAKPADTVQRCAGKSCDARHFSRKLQDSFRGLALVIEFQGF